MNTQLIEKVEGDQLKKIPEIQIGDTVRLHIRISEGEKSRIQIFEGIVLSIKGSGLNSTITVRKVSSGIGVEKIFPLHAPTLEKIEIVKRGKVRRAKLYYMRQRVGRRAMKISGSQMMTTEEDMEKEAADVATTAEKTENDDTETENDDKKAEPEKKEPAPVESKSKEKDQDKE